MCSRHLQKQQHSHSPLPSSNVPPPARADNSPHLSLMSYTWLNSDPELGGVLVMSTRRNTKKYNALVANPHVAILVHDFSTLKQEEQVVEVASDGGGEAGAPPSPCPSPSPPGSYSVTLYGSARVVTGETAERLRCAHLTANPRYPQFITGPDTAILTVRPTFVRMCDVSDSVTNWEGPGSVRGGGGGGGGGVSPAGTGAVSVPSLTGAGVCTTTAPDGTRVMRSDSFESVPPS